MTNAKLIPKYRTMYNPCNKCGKNVETNQFYHLDKKRKVVWHNDCQQPYSKIELLREREA